MKIHYILACSALLLSACSDNDEWQPGPKDPDGSTMAFFAPLTSYDVIIEPEMEGLLPVTVARGHSEAAATVPITVNECPDGVIVPTSVSFAAGEKSKTLTIDCTAMAKLTQGRLSLTIPEEYTSPYGAGTPSLDVSLNRAGDWLTLSDEMSVGFSRPVNGMTSLDHQIIVWLEGTNKFKFINFLDSGLDVGFNAINPDGNIYDIDFTANMIMEDDLRIIEDTLYDDTYPCGYYLWDDALNDWPEDWSIGGTTPEAYDLYIYSGTWPGSGDFTPWIYFRAPGSDKPSLASMSVLLTYTNEREHYIDFTLSFTSAHKVTIP